MKAVGAIILAAGESSRMRTNKLLLPYRNQLIITTIIDMIRQSKVAEILLVLGAFEEEIVQATKELPVRYCTNTDYQSGMLSSVQCGISNVAQNVDAVLIFLGDQPMISVHVVDSILEEYHHADSGLLVPVYLGKRGHPVLIDLKYKQRIMTLDQNEGLRGLFSAFPDDIKEVEVGNPGILRDIDTAKDYSNETKIAGYGTENSF